MNSLQFWEIGLFAFLPSAREEDLYHTVRLEQLAAKGYVSDYFLVGCRDSLDSLMVREECCYSGPRNSPHRASVHIPRVLCYHGPMFQMSYVPRVLYFQVPMFPASKVPPGPIFQRSYVPRLLCSSVLCSKGLMFLWSYITRVLCSRVQHYMGYMFYGPIFQRSCVPRLLHYQGPMF